MSALGSPIHRPVATAMFFAAIVMMGIVAWQTIPVELLPELSGDRLYVAFYRPGSEPDVVEREILTPLEARVTVLPGVEETWGEVRGSTGSLSIRFEPGANLKTRELELRRIAAELAREQPRGSTVDVENWDSSEFLRGFAMFIQVAGGGDRNALRHLIDERIEQRLLAVPDVSRVVAAGGASMELTVRIDPDRCAAQGVRPDEVVSALTRSVGRLRYMGGLEDAGGRTTVVLDGRPRGPFSVGDIGIVPGGAVRVRHVADVELGTGREEMLFRVNGSPSVGLIVYQEEGANLVRLGRALRARIDELREEFRTLGIEFTISFDAAKLIEEQLDRLEKLALTGFLIALAVLFLFLRQWRAVAVVAVAVPISLLAALALLYVSGFSINLVTLFALAVGIGMLVDNSIVVYEAVQRQLERGASPDHAVSEAIRRTVRAIVASSIANGIVFVPIMFLESESSFLRSLLKVIAVAYLLPLVGSLIVALGLVPLLARKLAAPAAIARLAALRRRRNELAGMAPPDRVRGMFVGLLTAALRRPAGWIATVIVAVLLTVVIALPWVGLSALPQESREADEVQLSIELPPGGSLEAAAEIFGRLELAALDLEGIESVESFVREEGGSLNVKLVDPERRPADLTAARVRTVVRKAAEELDGVSIESPQQGGDDGSDGDGFASLLGQGSSEIVVSGPEAARLRNLAGEIRSRLESMPEIESTSVTGRDGLDEIHVLPDDRALAAFGLTADQILPVLGVVRREGFELQTGFTLADDREIPMTVRRDRSLFRSASELGGLRVATASGVYPLDALAAVRKMPPPMAIRHHDGRRELGVLYNFNTLAPQSGPARSGLDRRIHDEIRNTSRPNGYTIETPAPDESTGWFKKLVAPVLLLLFAVLAITFESVTLPMLILLALPLTVLGSTWALVFSGTPLGPMGLIGALSLIGLTVNPAILLVDRMQHHARIGSLSAGAAALAAVRERARPVLMTTTTAVAGLWPLALVTGRENELWPPFATVVMGGLITSTALTLLVIPVGFVFLKKLDALFGRLGPWILVGWIGTTTAAMWPLVSFDLVTSTRWQIITGTLVAALVLGLAVLAFQRPVRLVGRTYWRGIQRLSDRPESPDPSHTGGGPPAVEVRSLRKVYGQPGPVRRAWRLPERFAAWVLRRGGRPFDPGEALQRLVPLALTAAGAGYLARWLHAVGWRILFTFVTAAIVARLLREVRRARGRADQLGRVEPGGPEGVAAVMAPWAAYVFLALSMYVLPKLADRLPEVRVWVPIAIAVVMIVSQLGRATALRVARGVIPERTNEGRLPRARSLWRSWSRRIFGLDLPRREVVALRGVEFRIERGMVGVLGPNGAGKTTLLRQLAGILEPSLGRITVGGVPLHAIRRYLGRWVGYLPQEFGLPKDLTAREYLEYYALLYEIGPRVERAVRIQRLIDEVGLTEKADQKIGSYSGGMRQRTAVARTLLRLPEIIIVDEPTVGLDPRERIRFRNLLSKLAEGRIVLFSTHVVEDVAVACERVIVLAGGRLVFDGPPPDLAHTARGSVWEIRVEPGQQQPDLPPGARIVDQVPEPDGGARIRVLHPVQPAPAARPAEPTLEDGYLCLVESSGEAAA